jgi:hypothetical protein
VRPKEEMELRKWASEGLSFLTLDADVKVQFSKPQSYRLYVKLVEYFVSWVTLLSNLFYSGRIDSRHYSFKIFIGLGKGDVQ